jgi:DNA replication licensing factor MCM6
LKKEMALYIALIHYIDFQDELGNAVKSNFLTFLKKFVKESNDYLSMDTSSAQTSENDCIYKETYYGKQVQKMASFGKNTLYVNFSSVEKFNQDLAKVISENFHRLESFLRDCVQEFIQLVKAEIIERSDGTKNIFFAAFYNLSTNPMKMRDLRAESIGKLSSFVGTVIRTSEVRPVLFLGTFRCGVCGNIIRDVKQSFCFTTPCICSNKTCANRKMWHLNREESLYCDWQKARVQELSDEVPLGSMPRSLDVILKADIVETVRPGDKKLFVGALIVVPNMLYTSGSIGKFKKKGNIKGWSGFGILGVQELTHRLTFLSSSTRSSNLKNKSDTDFHYNLNELTALNFTEHNGHLMKKIDKMKNDIELFKKLSISIVPHIHGLLDIKMSVILMLLGGVHKTTKDDVALRGDINILIVGDPSSAKSQILKYVSQFLPRALYTSGKGTSAAGLTASVAKDIDTHDYILEPGALMLADNGICCIDEIDKMNDKDKLALHEAMEQQTISISKAGIQATLNARTSILAAANPISGRYNKKLSLLQNLNLSMPIISRFDLVHIITDEPDESNDLALAEHIVKIHRYQKDALQVPYTKEELQAYVKFARTYKPHLSVEARKVMVYAYRRVRSDETSIGSRGSARITVRQLEALVRLSEALARLHCENVVLPRHVRIAVKLLLSSIQSVETDDLIIQDEKNGTEIPKNYKFSVDEQSKQYHRESFQKVVHLDKKCKTILSGSKYKIMSQLLLMRLRQVRELQTFSESPPNMNKADVQDYGLKQGVLIDWFIQYVVSLKLINSGDIEKETVLVPKVIRKLIKQGQILSFTPEIMKKEKDTNEEYSYQIEYSTLLIVAHYKSPQN